MLTRRTNVLFSEDEHATLVRLSKKHEKTMGELVRQAVRKTYKVEDKDKEEIAKRKKALKEIRRLAKCFDTKGINYKGLIEDGRKY